MRTPRQRGWASAALALSVTIMRLGSSPLRAEENGLQKPSSSPLSSALLMTRTRGVATVAVLTSSDQPSSIRFWNEFCDGTWARTNRGLVQIVNVSKDAEPGLVRTMGVSRFPTVIVYARGPRGVTQLGSISDCESAEVVVERLRALDFGLSPPGKADPALTLTSFGGDVYPSQQVPPPPQAYCPPVATVPPPQPTSVPLTPSVPQTVTATASLVQMPSQNLLIQQAPPQVFLAPAPSPIVYVPQMMSAAPAPVSGVTPVAAPAPAGNLFLTAPNLTVAPPPQPSIAVAPTPSLAVAAPYAPPMGVSPLAAAPALTAGPPAVASVTNQTLSLPTTASRTRVRVKGPGMVASSLARFGERLTRLGRARIETVQETTLEAPLIQPTGVGLTTISTTSTTPVGQGPTTMVVPVHQQQPPEIGRPPCSPAPPTLPSPQK
jgi:hypothetical protein